MNSKSRPARPTDYFIWRLHHVEIKAWLLSWSAAVAVLEPAELRAMVFQEVENLIKLLTQGCQVSQV